MSTSGLSPKNPSKYVGPNVYLATVVSRTREPTGADYRQPETGKLYPINSFWIVGKDPTNGAEGDLWYLAKIVANVAFWVQLSASVTAPLLAVTVPLGESPIVPNSFGVMNFTSTGGTVDITGSSASPNNHTINFDVIPGSFQPNAVIEVFDEFLPQNGTSSPGQLGWRTLGSVNLNAPTTTTSNPGVLTLSNGGLAGISLCGSATPVEFIMGGGVLHNNFVVDLVGLSTVGDRYTMRIGMSDDFSGGAIDNGIYFSYSDNVNSGNWVLNCTSGTVTTSVNTSIAASTGFHNYGFVVNANATSVSFLIDGVSAGTAITTNIPSLVINPYIAQIRSSGSLPVSKIDLWYLSQVLTTPR